MRYLALLLLLAGCASSPAELRESGTKMEVASKQEPLAAAHCMARNVEPMWFGILQRASVTLRPGLAGGYEVVTVLNEYSGTIGYALVEPAPGGSRITAWRRPSTPANIYQLDRIADGC